ncbi:putative small nuclear ribonucleoprotein G [Tanacetum coccineum]
MSRSGQPPDLKKYMDKQLQSYKVCSEAYTKNQEQGYEQERHLSEEYYFGDDEICEKFRACAKHNTTLGMDPSELSDLVVKLNANRTVVGTLRGFDQFMNLVIDNTVEVNGEEKNEIGMVVIRGNSVVTVEALEPVSRPQ